MTDAAPRILDHVPVIRAAVAGHRPPVILIDGRSGSGKTTLARGLADAIPGSVLVRLDDLYPGWDGLDEGSRMVVDDVLRADAAGWREWDWQVDRAGAWHPLDRARPLIVEGCGALSQAARARATYAVWVELDATLRRERALARDGATYAPHWERWARQEDRFITREDPVSLADLIIHER